MCHIRIPINHLKKRFHSSLCTRQSQNHCYVILYNSLFGNTSYRDEVEISHLHFADDTIYFLLAKEQEFGTYS